MRTKCLLQYVIVLGILFSCQPDRNNPSDNEQAFEAVETINKDSIAAPLVTLITAANAPLRISATEPGYEPLTYPNGIGAPSFINLNVGDGLPQNQVFDMQMDGQGNLWIGLEGGLTRFDGTQFTNYSTANGMGIGFEGRLIIDNKNNIWMSHDMGLDRFDGRSFHSIPLTKHGTKLSSASLCEDKDGNIWVTSEIGVYRIQGDSFTSYDEKQGLPANNTVNKICIDKKGQLLVSNSQGIFHLSGYKFEPYTAIPTINGVVPILVGSDDQGDVWYTRQSGNFELLKSDGTNTTVYTQKEGYHYNSTIHSMLQDNTGIIWFAGDNGVLRFDGHQFIQYDKEDGLPSNKVHSLVEDHAGNIWLGTDNGISRLSYNFMNNLESFPSREMSLDFIAFGSDGTKWGLDRTNNKLIQYKKDAALIYDLDVLKLPVPNNSISIDRSGQVWLSVSGNDIQGKIIRFDGQAFYVYGKEQGINISNFKTIKEDDEGNIWIPGDGGVLQYNGTSITSYGTAQGFPFEATAVHKDKKGQLWIGTSDSIIFKYDGTDVTSFNPKKGNSNFYINNITEDPFGNIWFATNRGVNKFDGKNVTTYGQVDGMNNIATSIAVDTTRQMLWFSFITGLVTMHFDQIDSPAPFLKHYYQRNGFDIISSHVQYNRSYFDSLGIWGSSSNGIYRFDYDKVQQFKEPVLQIKNILVDNQQLVWTDVAEIKSRQTDSLAQINEAVMKFGKLPGSKKRKTLHETFEGITYDSLQNGSFIPVNLELPYKNNSITFQYASISPSFGKHTHYSYTLEGFEDNWSPPGIKNEAYFGDISEGTYTFRLKAINATGSKTELQYSFRVLPPWWRTWWAYALYALIIVSGIYFFIRWRTRSLKNDKLMLEEMVNVRTNELKESLENLKSTQSQLIQSEKMASLGELTAGIAHEIQNPLNFVNNFSELSNELIGEMKEEIVTGNMEEVSNLANNIQQNLEKINHHGKRADAIVKGMLQHSQKSSGHKTPTDINALCDECLRISNHNFRDKYSAFDATLQTNFDPNLQAVDVVPQDIAKVIVNLINNALYAVHARLNEPYGKARLNESNGHEKTKAPMNDYQPTVMLQTKRLMDKIEIAVTDNGTGIPDAIREKIFQPFFTTKPTGQGTGLGLSLTYDIVKAHGGEIRVLIDDDQRTVFSILLPNRPANS